jgi:HK97 gp10 family phage protein
MADGKLHLNPILFNKYIKNLEKRIGNKIEQADAEFEAGMTDMERIAKQKAPADKGYLRASIKAVKEKPLTYILRANTRYAAYVEFGTGKYAKSYVQGLEEYWKKLASKYYKNGKGKTDRQPFFYPTVMETLPTIYRRIKEVLK